MMIPNTYPNKKLQFEWFSSSVAQGNAILKTVTADVKEEHSLFNFHT